jgi:hypothetical protein
MQEVVRRANTEMASQSEGEVAEFMREEDLKDITYLPSLSITNSNFFKVRATLARRDIKGTISRYFKVLS